MRNLNSILNEISSEILSEDPVLIQRGGGAIPAPSFAGNPGIASRPVGAKKDLDALRFQKTNQAIRSSIPQTLNLMRDVTKNAEITSKRDSILKPAQPFQKRDLVSQDELNARQHLYDINKKVSAAASDVSRQAQEKQAAEEAQLHALHKSQEGTPGFAGATENLPPDFSDVADKYNDAKMRDIARRQIATQSTPPAPAAPEASSQPPVSVGLNVGDFANKVKGTASELGSKISDNLSAAGKYLGKKTGEVGSSVAQGASDIGSTIAQGATTAGKYIGDKAGELGKWIAANPGWAAGGLGAALAAGAGAMYLRKKLRERRRNSAGY